MGAKVTSLFLDSLSLKGDQKPTLEEATRRLKAQSAAAERSPGDRAEGHRDAPCDCPPRGTDTSATRPVVETHAQTTLAFLRMWHIVHLPNFRGEQ